jgi:hypothetical protein
VGVSSATTSHNGINTADCTPYIHNIHSQKKNNTEEENCIGKNSKYKKKHYNIKLKILYKNKIK